MSDPPQAPDEHAPSLNQPSLSDWANVVPDQAADQQQAAQNDERKAPDAASTEPAAAAPAAVDAAAPAADASALAAAPPSRGHLVQEGDTVIVEVNRDRYSFVHIKRGGYSFVRHTLLCRPWVFGQPVYAPATSASGL